jgi:zinc protease
MEILDRKIVPAFKSIEKIELIHANEKRLRNNIPVYSINAGTQEIIKIEFLFSAGMYHQQMTLQATSVNSMLEEGTSKMNASQIADAVDFYGAFLEVGVEQDHASVVLYTLNKHLKATLPVIEQVIKDAAFPQSELETHLKNKKQKFLVNNQKVATLARKRFSELIFGEMHPYGRDVKDADFEKIHRDHLVQFYQTHYRAENCRIIVAGKVNDDVFSELDRLFGGNDWSGKEHLKENTMEIISTTEKEQLIFKEDALQSAIRIGKIMFNKTHPDYHPMQVLNTV